jgi:DNA-binding PadR family transcriptional regulator
MTNRNAPQEHLPLTPVVLHILLALTEGDRHGYAIAQDVEALRESQIRIGPGTLYGSIQRMLSAALIDEPARAPRADDDERRRYYRITALGRRVLALELQRLSHLLADTRAKRILRNPGVA